MGITCILGSLGLYEDDIGQIPGCNRPDPRDAARDLLPYGARRRSPQAPWTWATLRPGRVLLPLKGGRSLACSTIHLSIYIYLSLSLYIYTHEYIYMYTYTHIYIYIYRYIYTYTYVYIQRFLYICICTYTYMYVHISVYVYRYVYMVRLNALCIRLVTDLVAEPVDTQPCDNRFSCSSYV